MHTGHVRRLSGDSPRSSRSDAWEENQCSRHGTHKTWPLSAEPTTWPGSLWPWQRTSCPTHPKMQHDSASESHGSAAATAAAAAAAWGGAEKSRAGHYRTHESPTCPTLPPLCDSHDAEAFSVQKTAPSTEVTPSKTAQRPKGPKLGQKKKRLRSCTVYAASSVQEFTTNILLRS